MSQTDWLPGVAALVVGLGAGIALALRAAMRGRSGPLPAGVDPLTLRDLAAHRDSLFSRLRELAELAPGDGPEPLARERYATELEAARVVRDLERSKAVRAMETAKTLAEPLPNAVRAIEPPPRKKKLKKKRAGTVRLELRSLFIGMWLGGSLVLILFLLRDATQPRAVEPMAQASPPEAPRVSAEPDVGGTLELDPAVGALPAGTPVFILVRREGAQKGPPIAARRILADALPVEFAITPEDSMMGTPFPERARLEARVDLDGDPMTHDPTEPMAVVDSVARGASDVKLVLRRSEGNQR